MNGITVSGNVEGNIVTGDNNFVVNHNHGTIVYHEAAPRVQKRGMSPKPPRKPRSFVGRKRELVQVDSWIASYTPVIVHGVDGIGKTSLLRQAANSESAKSQPDGVVFLEGLDEAGQLLKFGDLTQRLFEALFESEPPLKVNLASARTYLSNTRPLVLLNSISLSSGDLGQLADLFPEAPLLIATEGMARVEGYEGIPLGPLTREDSLTLLASSTSVDDQETLSQIAALLENVPAALIIVANAIREKSLKVDEAFARLQSYTPSEKDKAKAAVERAFLFIFSTLTEDEHGMLDQMAAAFGISVDRKWLESLYGGSTVSEKLESLELLHANSPRLRLMPGLRPFLLRGRDFSIERERLLSHLLAELETRWTDFEFIQDELGNLLGLLFWSAAQRQWKNVAALGRAIDPYLTLRGLWDAWHKTLEEIQRAARTMQDLALEGWVLHQLGTYEIGMGDLTAAQKLLKRAISIRRKLGDETGVAYSQHNLQALIPAAKPSSRFGKLSPWLLSGIVVVALGAFLFFGNSQKNRTQPESVTEAIVAATEIKLVVSPLASPTATNTQTQTPSPSPTVTATFTPSPTDTPTTIPTYTTLTGKRVNHDHTVCRYGPGDPYLDKGLARMSGNLMDVMGRIEDGTWLLVAFSPPSYSDTDPCWMEAKYLDVSEAEVMSVEPVDPDIYLPIESYYPAPSSWPTLDSVIRKDDKTVIVSWFFYDVPLGDRESETSPRYLIEAWVCEAGKIVFRPTGWYGSIASITDETGCTEPSHARLYLAWKHGYAGPVEVKPWPQSQTVLSTPTLTPTP